MVLNWLRSFLGSLYTGIISEFRERALSLVHWDIPLSQSIIWLYIMESYHVEAYQAGIVWARSRADEAQLSRLSIFRQRLDDSRSMSWKEFFEGKGCCGYTAAELVAFEILGTEQGVQRADASDFWRSVLGEDMENTQKPGFIKAFAEGALRSKAPNSTY